MTKNIHLKEIPISHNTKARSAWMVSVDQLKSWSKCQKKYQYHVAEQYRWPTDPSNFDFGQDVHKLMDYQAKGLDCTAVLAHANVRVRKAWDLLLAHPTTQPERCLASEWGFTVPAPNNQHGNAWLMGRMDRLNHHDQTVSVIDWKTGTATPRNPVDDWQTRIYLYAAYEARDTFGLSDYTPEQFSFTYVGVKEKDNTINCVTVPYNLSMHEHTTQQLTHTLNTIDTVQQTQQYILPDKCPDKWCPYTQICGILTP